MVPIKTQVTHLVKYPLILIAAALLLSCNLFSLSNKPTQTLPPQEHTAVVKPTLEPDMQPTGTQSPTEEELSEKVEVLEFIYNQDFSKQPPDWDPTQYKNKDLEVNYSINNGVFSWAVKAVTNSSVMKLPDPGISLPEDGFLINVVAMIQPQDSSAASGIMFRFQDFENFYYAKLNATGEVSAFALEKNRWIKLAGPVKSDHWVSGKPNRLVVAADNGQYELRVNDYPVVNFSDDRFLGGKTGLIAELDAGMEETFIFDDFQVMKKGASAAVSNEEENSIPVGGGTYTTFEGDLNGIKYSIHLPASFIYHSDENWEKFCLDTDANLCVGIRRQSGNWNDPEEMANELMAGFSRDVTNFKIDHQQHTTTADGFNAFWVGSTYTRGGVDYESSHLFMVVQHVGVEIVGFGEPKRMETYRPILKNMMESFTLGYN